MRISIVDLRYKIKEVLSALDRREMVSVFRYGKLRGVIIPAEEKKNVSIREHALFGILRKEISI